jgi:hypothetical protein
MDMTWLCNGADHNACLLLRMIIATPIVLMILLMTEM